MIYSLTGTIVEKELGEVIIDVNGVAYQVAVTQTVYGALPEVGNKATLYTYLNVKEDDMELYGFANKSEQKCFKIITGVSGVGPKVGLAILSSLSPDKIALAVASGDHKTLTVANGVGPKLAQRIVLELKGKFDNLAFVDSSISNVGTVKRDTQNVSQAMGALISLGYSQSQATLAISKLDSTLDVEELIKQSLKLLSGGKV